MRGYGVVDAHAAWVAAHPDIASADSMQVITGTVLSGGIPEIVDSDDTYLQTRSGFGQTFVDLHHMEAQFGFTASTSTPLAMDIRMEARISESVGNAQLSILNQVTGQYDLIGQHALNDSDQGFIFAGIDAAEYIGVNGEIEIRIKHLVFVPFFAFTFESFFDLIQIEVYEDPDS